MKLAKTTKYIVTYRYKKGSKFEKTIPKLHAVDEVTATPVSTMHLAF